MTLIAIKKVFKDDRSQLQSTLTNDNLIWFLKTARELIVSGDKKVFRELSERQTFDYTRQIIHLQNVQGADKAWTQKDFINFIKCMPEQKKVLLPESYFKNIRSLWTNCNGVKNNGIQHAVCCYCSLTEQYSTFVLLPTNIGPTDSDQHLLLPLSILILSGLGYRLTIKIPSQQ